VEPLVWDSLLALVLLVAHVLGAVVVSHKGGSEALATLLIVLACAPLALRRRTPIVAAVLVATAAAAYALADLPGDLAVPLAVAIYTAAAYRDRGPVLALALPASVAAAVVLQITNPDVNNWVDVLSGVVISVGLPMLLGRMTFNRRRRIAEDRERAARDAVAAERARIARELHDVVAHAMSVMVVQAGAARTALGREPATAEGALRLIEEVGRDGLGEMRRLIGLLRPDDPSDLAPQPDLAHLDELLGTMRHAGLQVEALVEGDPRGLPRGVELTAYRVVQEALTNVLRHAGESHARVLLRFSEDALEVEVFDDGLGPPREGTTLGGHGLIGMRERVELFGGSLETGPRPGGGFEVRARLPAGAGDTA
jgi:signal transduction histidine kinase